MWLNGLDSLSFSQIGSVDNMFLVAMYYRGKLNTQTGNYSGVRAFIQIINCR